jgi:hypothetical protein
MNYSFTKEEKCAYIQKKWFICNYLNYKFSYKYDCEIHLNEFLKECVDENFERVERDKIFKASIFATH